MTNTRFAQVLVFCAATLLLASTAGAAPVEAPANAFADPAAWKPHADGGRATKLSAEATPFGAGLRIRYVDDVPHWGNTVGPCTVPPRAVALRLRVSVHGGSPRAAMHIWLLQPSGDGWASRSLFDGQPAGRATPGWHDVRMPVSGFDFEPRGTAERNMTSSTRMLIGCNFGDLDMTVADMRWELAGTPGPVPLPRRSPAVERGSRGSIAVLDLGGALPDGFRTGHDPARFARRCARAASARR